MQKTLGLMASDQRIPKSLLESMRDIWTDGMGYAKVP
jgi:hypothetical protein